jgi:AP-3 complex subunit mu
LGGWFYRLRSNGTVITQDISGDVQVTSRLSGMPDLLLSFNNPAVIDDVRCACCSLRRPLPPDTPR